MPTQMFQPKSWDEIYGNYRIKRYFRSLRRNIDAGSNLAENVLISGGRREGKTCSAMLAIRMLHCIRVKEPCMSPCLKCSHCGKRFPYAGAMEGDVAAIYDAVSRIDGHPYLIRIGNGAAATPESLTSLLEQCRADLSVFPVIWIDEVRRLQTRCIEILLPFMDQHPSLFIGTTTEERRGGSGRTGNDSEAFAALLDRFGVKLRTQLPNYDEFRQLCTSVGERSNVIFESDDLIDYVFQRVSRVPGMAVPLIAGAALANDGRLTRDYIDEQIAIGDEFLGE